MKIKEALYLNKLSAEAIKLHELYKRSITLSRWLTDKIKKDVTDWQITIEPKGLPRSYNHMIYLTIPRDLGLAEIQALAKILKKETKTRLDNLKVEKTE